MLRWHERNQVYVSRAAARLRRACDGRQAVRLATWLLFITDARARRADKIATSITGRWRVAEFTHAEQRASHADRATERSAQLLPVSAASNRADHGP